MITRGILTAFLSVLVLAEACGGGEASTANAPNVPTTVEKSTVVSPPTSERTPTVQTSLSPSAIPVDEAARGFYNLGNTYNSLGLYKLAIEYYDEAIHLDPQFALAYMNRGVTYMTLGQLERAIQDYDEAIRRTPS